MNDPSPRLNRMLPDPVGEIAAANEIKLLTERMSRLLPSIGISVIEAVTVASEPDLM
ncbi:hypothetical protein [Rhodopila sp.]|uniref:hypothetical protein n=1 Tax=Rhodopila sp. TaxID=2480087 RepID=UPI003D09709B